MNRIIFIQNNGTVAVMIPSPECLEQHGIQAIAIKDVPAGKPFKIVNATDIPTDRSERYAWTVEVSDLNDGVGGESNEFPPKIKEAPTHEVSDEPNQN